VKTYTLLGTLVSLLVVTACAVTPATPLRFELIDDQAKVHVGTYDTVSRNMQIAVGDQLYSGFYVVDSSTVTTQAFPGFYRRPFPVETRGEVTSNHARAHLRSAAGDHISCEFTFDGERAVGNCRNPAGKSLQFVAGN
jgi:hypothetical protein